MKYLSVCSGIEAATVAWHHMGWQPVAFSEIEPFPSAVLAHHYPHVPNVGDMTKFKEWNLEPIDLLVGGTPCQSFSIAGLRKGLDDPRGNLMLTFLAIAERYRPQWIVWENVPGVLSSNGGRDFGTFLAALGELGYGWAYRVLDAQWFGVAQRRRRVFVVGCLGDQAGAAAVLFESESVCWNPAPSREKGQGVARGVTPSVAGSLDTECGGGKLTHQSVANGHIIGTITARMFNSLGARDVEEGALLPVAQPVAGSHWDSPANPHPTLNQSAKGSGGIAASDQELFSQRGSGLVAQPVAFAQNTRDEVRLMNGDGSIVGALAAEPGMKQTCYVAQPVAQPITFGAQMSVPQTDVDMVQTLQAKNPMAVAQPIAIQGTLIGRGDNAGPQGSGVDERGSMFTLTKTDVHAVAQPVAIRTANTGANGHGIAVDVTHTLDQAQGQAVAQPVAFKVRGGVEVDSAGKAAGKGYLGSEETAFTLAATQDQWVGTPPAMQVRRLTPTECERLQGFPDGWTNIPWRKKDEAPDGPRYKALGNSMAVPCMKWIGERIQAAVERQEVPR